MGITKNDLFSKEQNLIASMIKALGHPARIAILEYILKSDSCICADIVDELPLAQPTVSQHLKELKKVGLIKGSIEGNTICYCIDKEIIKKLKVYFDEILLKLDSENITNCC
jgi:ArsR family transcriptional regulator